MTKKIKTTQKIPITKDAVKKSIEDASGNFSKAARVISGILGEEVSRQRFQYWMEHYDLKYFPTIVRKNMVKAVLDTAIKKAVEYGDNFCIGKILDKWGHYVEFTDRLEDSELEVNSVMIEAMRDSSEPDLTKARDKDLENE